MKSIKIQSYKIRLLIYPYLSCHNGTYYIYQLHLLFNRDPELLLIQLCLSKSKLSCQVALHLKLKQRAMALKTYAKDKNAYDSINNYITFCTQSICYYKQIYRLLSSINSPDWISHFSNQIDKEIKNHNEFNLLFYKPNKFTFIFQILTYITLAITIPINCKLNNLPYISSMLTLTTALIIFYFLHQLVSTLGKFIFRIPLDLNKQHSNPNYFLRDKNY